MALPPVGTNYEGRVIRDKVQLAETSNGYPQIGLDMELRDKTSKEPVGGGTTILVFSEKSATYSFERLRLLGWKGGGADDIDKLGDIFDAWVPCQVDPAVPYQEAGTGIMKPGYPKLQITSNAGSIQLDKPLDANSFKARMKAVLSGQGTGATSSSGGAQSGEEPPF